LIVPTDSALALPLKLISATELLEPVIVLVSPRKSTGSNQHWGVILTERLDLVGKQFENVRGLSFCVDEEATNDALSIDVFDGQLVIAELPGHQDDAERVASLHYIKD